MNRQFVLAARPRGLPTESDFRLVTSPIPEPKEGEMLLRIQYLSVDPYMRGRMDDRKSYVDPVSVGQVMPAGVVGVVEKSCHRKFAEGDVVTGMLGWQEYGVTDGKGFRKLIPGGPPVSTALHMLGMPGLTAYFGLLDVCRPESGQTVVVSGAAGAVGSAVGQIARIKGCRVVGIAGSDEKVKWITDELGFDHGFNYKKTENYYQTLKTLCPDGIHAYFDNVGGPVTDAVFPLLSVGGRVAICGQISQYNLDKPEQGPRLLWHLIVKRATVQGFLVLDYAERYREGLEQLTAWIQAGQLKYRENVVEGFENMPKAFLGLFQGDNIGKQLVKIG